MYIQEWTRENLVSFIKNASAILFDLDGTLFDLNVDWAAIKSYFQDYHHQKFQETLPTTRFYEIFEYVEKTYGSEVVRDYITYLQQTELKSVSENENPPLWLVTEGLTLLSEYISYDTFYGIISSNFHNSIIEVLNKGGLKDRFKVIIGRDDVVKAKPNPEGIIRVVDSYELDSDTVLYIGDVKTDELAAQQAGVRFIYVHEMEKWLKKD